MNVHSNRITSYLYWRLVLKNPKLKRWLIRLLLPDKDVSVPLLATPFTLNLQKESGYYQASRDFSRPLAKDELPVVLSLALLLESGDTFVDIGANVGFFSGLLSRTLHSGRPIDYWAFEANPDTFKRLKQNVPSAVKTVCTALSDQKETLNFYSDGASATFGAKPEHSLRANVDVVQIEASRLDSYPIAGRGHCCRRNRADHFPHDPSSSLSQLLNLGSA